MKEPSPEHTLSKLIKQETEDHQFNKCSYKTKSCSFMRNHIVQFSCTNNELEMYKCDNCYFSTHLWVKFSNHVRLFHRFVTPIKMEEFNSVDNMHNHNCVNCDFRTFSRLIMIKHVYVCESSKANLKEHVQSGPNKCTQCPYTTKWNSRLKQRTLIKHSPSEDITWFKCEDCSFITRWNVSLKSHILGIHTAAILHKCTECSYKTNLQGNLKGHMRRKHAGPEDIHRFKCEQCPYKTYQRSNLKIHILGKHTATEQIKWFKCGHCPFKTKYKSSLKQHLPKKHDKWFEDEPSSETTKLKIQVLGKSTVEDIKWFACGQCSYKARVESRVKNHSAAEDRWFECEQCVYKTHNQSNLKRHVLGKHAAVEVIRWFECGQCSFKTKVKTSLRLHKSRKHN